MNSSRLACVLIALTFAACSAAAKPTSPTACVTLAKMECRALLKQLRSEIRPGQTRASAEATLTKYGLIYKYVPRSEVAQKENPGSNRSGRLTLGLDDGYWPAPRTQGYIIDIAIDKQDLVAGFHVNTITAP